MPPRPPRQLQAAQTYPRPILNVKCKMYGIGMDYGAASWLVHGGGGWCACARVCGECSIMFHGHGVKFGRYMSLMSD